MCMCVCIYLVERWISETVFESVRFTWHADGRKLAGNKRAEQFGRPLVSLYASQGNSSSSAEAGRAQKAGSIRLAPCIIYFYRRTRTRGQSLGPNFFLFSYTPRGGYTKYRYDFFLSLRSRKKKLETPLISLRSHCKRFPRFQPRRIRVNGLIFFLPSFLPSFFRSIKRLSFRSSQKRESSNFFPGKKKLYSFRRNQNLKYRILFYFFFYQKGGKKGTYFFICIFSHMSLAYTGNISNLKKKKKGKTVPTFFNVGWHFSLKI